MRVVMARHNYGLTFTRQVSSAVMHRKLTRYSRVIEGSLHHADVDVDFGNHDPAYQLTWCRTGRAGIGGWSRYQYDQDNASDEPAQHQRRLVVFSSATADRVLRTAFGFSDLCFGLGHTFRMITLVLPGSLTVLMGPGVVTVFVTVDVCAGDVTVCAGRVVVVPGRVVVVPGSVVVVPGNVVVTVVV
jgi:hypothetical protein